MAKVFISYSHDSPEHAERVRSLDAGLARDGCDCRIDVYKDTDEDWPTWMTRQLIEADFILCGATETYHRRFRDQELPDVGQGVGWEAGLIRRLLYAKKLHNDRIFPVIFDKTHRQYIPLELQSYDYFLLDGPSGYESLLRKVLGRPLHARPVQGTPPDLQTRTTEPLFPRPDAHAQAETAEKRIAPSRLLDLGVADRFDELVGRTKERKLLTDAWNDDTTRILTFVAEGGVGKTSLVADWLMDFVKTGWSGVDAFFDWSFYSQGTRDQTTANSGLFFDAALRHFGETALADSPASADQKADRLAECVARARTLLILDGVEPLQHPKRPGGLEGRFKDTGIERLLKRLAQMPGAHGLCVVTTRVPVVDLRRFHGTTVQEHLLDHLSEEACAQLLHQVGARRAGNKKDIPPDDPELLKAAGELKGHALAAQLLGGYLKQAYAGDIRCRDRVKWTLAFDEQQEGHAWSVMQAYEHWFQQQGDTGLSQLAALRLLGFFDRPADVNCLDVLRSGPAIAGLTEPLAGVSQETWNGILTQLAGEHRLISLRNWLSAVGNHPSSVDAHPLVREYFASQLQRENNKAWTEGHRRLFRYLCETTEYRPATLEGLQPLYQAVSHGCRAGLYQEAREKVYRDRILRGTGSDGFYSTRKLGAFGSDLGAVACFFESPWSRVSPQLSEPAQAWLLNQAALCLRALGRLTEALEPMRAGQDILIRQEEWRQAARSTSNLSELELTLGQIARAVSDAEQSATFADRSQDAFQCIVNRTTHADALHQAGERGQALDLYREAEKMQAEWQPKYPLLTSVGSFRYCDLLLAPTERQVWRQILQLTTKNQEPATILSSVSDRAEQTLKWVTPQNWLLDIALDHLTLARVRLYQAILTNSPLATCHSPLEDSVNGLRAAGTTHHIPRGLLTRAWLRFLEGDQVGAQQDLDEVQDTAERGSMRLHLADCHLYRARLFKDKEALMKARTLIQECGYHRRDEELAEAEKASARW